MIIHDFGLLISLRSFFIILLLLELALVIGIGTRSFIVGLDVSCVIIALWKGVDHFLYIIELYLPLADVCVHVLNESTRRRSFEFIFWDIFPDAIYLLQVWK